MFNFIIFASITTFWYKDDDSQMVRSPNQEDIPPDLDQQNMPIVAEGHITI